MHTDLVVKLILAVSDILACCLRALRFTGRHGTASYLPSTSINLFRILGLISAMALSLRSPLFFSICRSV